MLMEGLEAIEREVKGEVKQAPLTAKNAELYYPNKKLSTSNKTFTTSKSSRMTLTNKEINDVIKVIKSLENIAALLKETAQKSYQSKWIICSSLMTFGLPLVKSVPHR